MRRAFVLLATLTLTSLNACELFTGPEGLTMHVQGTVTAADEGWPMAGALVEFRRCETESIISCTWRTVDSSTTDAKGHYSLSYFEEGYCGDTFLGLVATAQGFSRRFIGITQDPHLTCTEELQTIDIQLVHLEAV